MSTYILSGYMQAEMFDCERGIRCEVRPTWNERRNPACAEQAIAQSSGFGSREQRKMDDFSALERLAEEITAKSPFQEGDRVVLSQGSEDYTADHSVGFACSVAVGRTYPIQRVLTERRWSSEALAKVFEEMLRKYSST